MIPEYVVCSPQEYRVANELMRDGASNRVIARRLGISEETVKCHFKSIYSKCPAQFDRTSLVVALFHGDIEIVSSGRLVAAS